MEQIDLIIIGLLCIPLILRIDFYYQLSKLIKSNSSYTERVNPKIIYLPLIPLFGIYYLFKIAKEVDLILDEVFNANQINKSKDIYQLLAVTVVLQVLLIIVNAFNTVQNPLPFIFMILVNIIRIILGTILYYNVDKAKKLIRKNE
jgi:hypothetical protein